MNIQAKKEQITVIYDDYSKKVQQYKVDAVCKAGCAFCCTHFGSVDVITLEGWIIHEWLGSLEPPLQKQVRKQIAKNVKMRQKRANTPCPFLKKDNTCRVYAIRPFSCRQLYSLKECSGQGPTVHRQAVALAKETVSRLQRLDNTGYSGHISYILHLVERPGFRKLYASGGFNPRDIAAFGKTHGIVINRMVSGVRPESLQKAVASS